jgi:citronellol/citronellal dehydrogenase
MSKQTSLKSRRLSTPEMAIITKAHRAGSRQPTNMYASIFRAGLFHDQTVLITGGGTGIGRAIAHELASLGAHVLLAARREEKLVQVAAEITQAGGTAAYYHVNIRDEASVIALYEAVLREHGTLHALVNNAGGQFMSPAQNINKKGWHAVVETNLTGTFMMSREAFSRVFAEHGGAIVNIVADMWQGFPGMAHTGAARAGVVNLTKTLAVEWARSGVRVNAVAPGLIEGSGFTTYPTSVQAWVRSMKKNVPLKRFGTEAEVAAAVTFLLSPAAAYITGETLRVDGASSLWRSSWEIDDHDNAPPPFEGFS